MQGNQTDACVRRVSVNVAPLGVKALKKLQAAGIGAFQVFQETYDRALYPQIHLKGSKADFAWRLMVMHRALEAGIGEIGMGVLYGLSDWRFDTLALLQHIAELTRVFGAFGLSLSVPRLEPAHGAPFAGQSPPCG